MIIDMNKKLLNLSVGLICAALICFGIVAFVIHPVVLAGYLGVVLYALGVAANEARKDLEKKDDPK